MNQTNWTISAVMKSAKDFLAAKGIENPRLDIELLLAKSLGISRLDLYLKHDKPLSKEERDQFKLLLFRRAANEPAAYILGEAGFMGHLFKVNRHTLVPRPDTEVLVEECLKYIPESTSFRLLDIGAGTGCIGISLLMRCENLFVESWDIHEDTLEIAQWNAGALGVSDRYEAKIASALQSESYNRTFDAVVSNPPYIDINEFDSLDSTVKDFEPYAALVADQGGLLFYEKISASSSKIIRPGGFIAFEIGWNQGEPVREILERNRFVNIKITKDLGSRDRVVTAQMPNA